MGSDPGKSYDWEYEYDQDNWGGLALPPSGISEEPQSKVRALLHVPQAVDRAAVGLQGHP